MALTLTVLLENRRAAGAGKTLLAKPGLSLLVQDETTTILFDTGPDGSFMHQRCTNGRGPDALNRRGVVARPLRSLRRRAVACG